MNSLVSICIPTYNGEKYLQESLDSVKAQTYKNIEVIISDDQSKDRTLEICEQFKSEVAFPVHIHSHLPSGIGANWNHSIMKANGEYIKFLFQDDILEPNCVEVMMKVITEKKLVAVCSKRSIIDDKGLPVTSGEWYSGCYDLQKTFLNLDFKDLYIFQKKDLKKLYPNFLTSNIFGEPIAFLFKKTVFSEIGYFSSKFKQILDIEFAYRILEKHPVGIIEEKLFRFRLHDDQATTQNKLNHDLYTEDELFKTFVFTKFFRHLNFKTKKFYLRRKYKIFNVIFYQYEINKYRLKKLLNR